MKLLKKSLLLCLSLILVTYEAGAMEEIKDSPPKESPGKIRRAFLRDFVGETDHPNDQVQATLVICTCHTAPVDLISKMNCVVVRSFGNQLASAKNLICECVRRANVPLLVFIGHSECGAIKAKLEGAENDPQTPQTVKDALKNLYVDDRNKNDLNQGTIKNLTYQVEQAVHEFRQLTTNNKFKVIGVIKDDTDDFGRGKGRFIFTNVNEITNPVQLAGDSDLKGLSHPMIGVGEVERNIIENKFKETEEKSKKTTALEKS